MKKRPATLVGRLRSRFHESEIEARARAYQDEMDLASQQAVQLEMWNTEWRRVLADIPYYQELQQRHHLPVRFRSWEEFSEVVPPTTRELLQHHKNTMTSRSRRHDFMRMTGGSTAAPVQMPAWKSELAHGHPDAWVARGWYGVTPSSRLFLIWGHGHLLGSGLRGRINGHRRRLQDRLLGYHRFSAYDLQPAMLRKAGRALLEFQPDYLLGYSVALHLFGQENRDLLGPFRSLGLKVVIGTAENFPTSDAPGLLHELFNCPVAMEYGSVETGVMAHTHPEGGYRVFWRSYMLEAERTSGDYHLLRVTSLYPRAFPLVRYEIGDEVELRDPSPAYAGAIHSFKRVVGRCNDYVSLPDGALIHSEAFSHAVRPCAEIRSFQVVQARGAIRIRYTAAKPLSATVESEIRGRLSKVHPSLNHLVLEQVEQLPQTVAGKTRMIATEPSSR